jgi:hypothetical protein
MTELMPKVKLLDIDRTGNWYVKTIEICNDKNLQFIASFHTHQDNGFLEPENLTNMDFIKNKFRKLSTGFTTDNQPITNDKRCNDLFQLPCQEPPYEHLYSKTLSAITREAKASPEFLKQLISLVKSSMSFNCKLEQKLTRIIINSIQDDIFGTNISNIYQQLFHEISSNNLSQDDLIRFELQETQNSFEADFSEQYLLNNRCVLGNWKELELFTGSFGYDKEGQFEFNHFPTEPIEANYITTLDSIRKEMVKETMANYLYVLERQICAFEDTVLKVFIQKKVKSSS